MYKKIVFVLVCSLLFQSVFAQQENQSSHNDENPVEIIDSSLQKNFVMIESIHPHELNPQVTSYASDSQLLSGLFEGLFSYNPVTLEPQFAIATNIKVSRDKMRMIFTIRDDAKFSNGEKITAQDVRYSWLHLLATPEAPYASLLDVIEGVSDFRMGKISEDKVGIYATSDTTLLIHLAKPANYLPKVLCHSAFSVIHRTPTVYSGAFYLDDCDETTYILKKNPYYWDSANTHLEQISIYQSDNSEENAFLFNSGLADWVTAPISVEKVLNKKSMQLNAEFATNYIFFKTSQGKPSKQTSVWDKPSFRKALLEALPWDELRSGYYVPATTFVYPLAGYSGVNGYDFTDVEQAKKLMKQARENEGISEEEKIPLVLEISENSLSDNQLVLFKNTCDILNIDLQVKVLPSYAYLSSVKTSESDLFVYVWIGDFADPLAFLELFRSESSLNDSGWKNVEFDNLLQKAALSDEFERYNLLAQAENILLDECMIIPIQHPVTFNVIDLECVGGWAANAFDIHPLKYLYKKPFVSKVQNVVKSKN